MTVNCGPSRIIKVSQIWARDYEAIYELRLFASVLLGEFGACVPFGVFWGVGEGE